MIRNIIFDFGGVILLHKHTVTQDILQEMFPSTYDEVKKIWDSFKGDINTGKKTSDDFLQQIIDADLTNTSLYDLHMLWSELYKREALRVDTDLLNFIQQLKTKYQVYLFTDTIDVHDEYNATRNIYENFDAVYKSFEEGVAKYLGKDAFLHVLGKIGAKPEECIFIDDMDKNTIIAESIGIKSIVYRNKEQLKKELRTLGVSF